MNRQKLVAAIKQRNSFLCVGLDSDLAKIPPYFRSLPNPLLEFNKMVIDETRDLCVSYKFNIAFYEMLGEAGWRILKDSVDYIGNEHLIIADAKRGDIGNTSKYYAETFFSSYNFDAVTIAPYMGKDSVVPFLEFKDKWSIVLGHTSNEGSNDFQKLKIEGTNKYLYEIVLEQVKSWADEDRLMFVIGATHPESFERVRRIVPGHFLLIPGVGAQGGDLKAIYTAGKNDDIGLLVNSSRGIIYVGGQLEELSEIRIKVRNAAFEIQRQMEVLLSEDY